MDSPDKVIEERYEDLRRDMHGLIGVIQDDGDRMQCHVCGHWYKSVAAHVWQAHNLQPDEYREAFGINHQYGLTAQSQKDHRSEMQRRRLAENLDHREKLVKAAKAVGVESKRKGGKFARRPQLRRVWAEHAVSFVCEWCGEKVFAQDSSRRKYCSLECSNKATGQSRTTQVKANRPPCVVCGKEIEYRKGVSSQRLKVCSPECNRIRAGRASRERWQSGTMKERENTKSLKTCEMCGTEFMGIYSQKYCQSQCMYKAFRLRKKAAANP